ncbi:MAG: Rubrerythrin [candidate division WS1 bacterium]|jgi:rubrerythrin|nr:Rubrerythrin [candidate division WS1 bacterium]
MPEFVNPFSGVTPDRKMTFNELIRALRLNLAAEQEAIHLYQAHADATDNELARAVLLDIADEEREHVGEFQRLINILVEDEEKLLADGAAEVDELAEEINSGGSGEESEESAEESDSGDDDRLPTVGDLTK